MTIPAGHPDLISVGATLNRTTWTDRLGDEITVNAFGSAKDPTLDSIAFFSSAGPTTDLRMKPDILAPGAFVVGAMSADADPRKSPVSIFSEAGTCSPAVDCAVVDATHAVTLGTSMAAPIITGALALLFEQNPALTGQRALTLLQAGARRPHGLVQYASQLGAGVLDLPGTLDVEDVEANRIVREPAAGQSFLSVGATYAHPDPSWSVPVLLKLRDANGNIADGFDAKKLTLDVQPGKLTDGLTRAAAGLYRAAIAAERNTGGDALSITATYDGKVLAAESIPIAVDVSTARQGFAARGGCSLARTDGTGARSLYLAAIAFTALRSRRCRRGVRKARSRGRTDTSDRGRPGWSPRRASRRRR